jgi:multiple sugar transport system permease protein
MNEKMEALASSASTAARSAVGDFSSGRARLGEPLWKWATFSPALLLMLGLSVLPVANLVWMSFFNVTWSGGKAIWNSVGIDHYRDLVGDGLFGVGLLNTFIFAAGAVFGQMALGFLAALLCSRISRGRVLYRAVFILPILIPGIVVGAIWKLMLNYDFGIINELTGMVGLDAWDWLGSSSTALMSVMIVDIWHWTPFCFLLFLAGLESLPQDVYEAAQIDGANAWQEFFWITLPMMSSTIAVTFAFRSVLAFKVFDEVYLLTGGGPGTATQVVSFTLYQRFFSENRMGYGAAMSVVVIFVVSLMLVLSLSVKRRAGSTS